MQGWDFVRDQWAWPGFWSGPQPGVQLLADIEKGERFLTFVEEQEGRPLPHHRRLLAHLRWWTRRQQWLTPKDGEERTVPLDKGESGSARKKGGGKETE